MTIGYLTTSSVCGAAQLGAADLLADGPKCSQELAPATLHLPTSLDTHGEAAWGMKTYSYEYFENTYAISKLAFRSIVNPAYSPHDKPGPGSDTAGIDDSGIITFSASFEDWSTVDIIFISGTDPFETKTVLFTEWIMTGNAQKGIESGDEVRVESDDILVQTGGFTLVKGDEFLFKKLDEKGLIRRGRGEMTAVAIVPDAVRPGVLFAGFIWPRWPGASSNSLVHRVPDPITQRYRFKLGKGRISKVDESPFKNLFDAMSCKPRTIA